MFKKPIKVSAQNQLSGKDKKVTKSKLEESFDSDCVQKIFTANDKMICCKISGAKLLIYNGEEYPLFVDGTGKHNYFPSLYVAMAYQPLIKTLIINQGVQTYIYNGANLMWPGVRDFQGLGEFNKDQTVGIRNSKGEIIAIGAMGCSRKQLTDTNGVAVYILHYLGDKLWEMGTKTFPEVIIPLKVQDKFQILKEQQSKPEQIKQEIKKQQIKNTQITKKENQKSKNQLKKAQDQPKEKKYQKKKEKSVSEKQSSDDQVDFSNLMPQQQNQQKGRVIKMEPKANLKNAFVQDQNQQKNTKNKKKHPAQQQKPKPKGGKNKKQDSQPDIDIMQEEQEQLNIKKAKDNKKGGKKKGNTKQQKKPKKKNEESEGDEIQPKGQEYIQQKKKKQDSEEQKDQPKSTLNTKLMDEYFKESMFNAIKLTKIEGELPIDSGKFYMDYMLLARPEGVKLDIKQSTYKKIGKFFQEMAKKKIIEYKHPKDKKAQGATINKIFWENQQLKNHVPTIKKLGSKQQQQKVETYSKAKLKLSKTVTLDTVYKPSQDLFNEIFKKPLNLMPAQGELQVTDKQQIQFVTQKQLRQKIERYINLKIQGKKQQKQPKKAQKFVLIDYTKNEFLRQLLKKQIEMHEENKEKDELLKADQGSDQQGNKKKKNKKGGVKQLLKIDRGYLVQKIMKKALPHHHLYDKQNDIDRFKQGNFKGIQLTAQKVANKNVTRIVGLELFITPKKQVDDQIHGFANLLQLKFACSVNVQNLPGKGAGKQIILHGAFLDELEQMLTQQYELSNKFITTLNKLEKKKKN